MKNFVLILLDIKNIKVLVLIICKVPFSFLEKFPFLFSKKLSSRIFSIESTLWFMMIRGVSSTVFFKLTISSFVDISFKSFEKDFFGIFEFILTISPELTTGPISITLVFFFAGKEFKLSIRLIFFLKLSAFSLLI